MSVSDSEPQFLKRPTQTLAWAGVQEAHQQTGSSPSAYREARPPMPFQIGEESNVSSGADLELVYSTGTTMLGHPTEIAQYQPTLEAMIEAALLKGLLAGE
jgi:hypothetical protein